MATQRKSKPKSPRAICRELDALSKHDPNGVEVWSTRGIAQISGTGADPLRSLGYELEKGEGLFGALLRTLDRRGRIGNHRYHCEFDNTGDLSLPLPGAYILASILLGVNVAVNSASVFEYFKRKYATNSSVKPPSAAENNRPLTVPTVATPATLTLSDDKDFVAFVLETLKDEGPQYAPDLTDKVRDYVPDSIDLGAEVVKALKLLERIGCVIVDSTVHKYRAV